MVVRGGAQPSVPIQTAVPFSVPSTPVETRVETGYRTGRQAERMRVTLMLAACGFFVIAGVAYLSGYARLTYEGYRRASLGSMLSNQMALAHQWRHNRAITLTASNIEAQAKGAGMVPADDSKVVNVR